MVWRMGLGWRGEKKVKDTIAQKLKMNLEQKKQFNAFMTWEIATLQTSQSMIYDAMDKTNKDAATDCQAFIGLHGKK